MDLRPIGVFDSGLGGLTAVMALRELLPEEDIVYFGDTARMPYGVRPAEQLKIIARQNMELLDSCGAKAILAACGTVSSTAGDVLSSFHLPVFNVLDAAAEELAKMSGTAPIGIIATEASIKSGVFERKISKLCPKREIIPIACQDFVSLIESGHLSADDESIKASVESYLRPIKNKKLAALLLGCTHFGFLSQAIREYLGDDVRLVSASECAARQVRDYIVNNALKGEGGEVKYMTSGDREQFAKLSSRLLGENIRAQTVHVDAMEV